MSRDEFIASAPLFEGGELDLKVAWSEFEPSCLGHRREVRRRLHGEIESIEVEKDGSVKVNFTWLAKFEGLRWIRETEKPVRLGFSNSHFDQIDDCQICVNSGCCIDGIYDRTYLFILREKSTFDKRQVLKKSI